MATKRMTKGTATRKRKQNPSYGEKMTSKLNKRLLNPMLKAMRKAAKKI